MLTDLQLRALKPRDKQYKVADTEGLYVVINTTGTKTWRLKYRFAGAEKTLSIGKYPEVSINQARLRRAEAKELLAQGIDPSAAKQIQKAELRASLKPVTESKIPTFKSVGNEYMDEVGQVRSWSVKHAMKIAATLRGHVYPVIGDLLITEIEPTNVLTCYQLMQKKGLIELPEVALENIQQVFLFASMKGYTHKNPVPAMRMFVKPAKKGQMAAMHYTRLGEFQLRLAMSRADELFRLAALFLMHTAVRTKEMRFAKWSEFDLEKRVWSIPAERMKMGTGHKVPLTDAVIDLLDQIRQRGISDEFVFGSHYSRKNPVISENAVCLTIKAMGYVDATGKATHTGHGFRSCFSSGCNAYKDEFGANAKEAIEFCLAHVKQDQVEAAYNREDYWATRVAVMNWWSRYLLWLRDAAQADQQVVNNLFSKVMPSIDPDQRIASARYVQS